MVNIQKMLENSKKPYLTKLGTLEKKKAAFLEKIDSDIKEVTARLESIDSAIEALNTLTEGDRLVGIISHVQELKTRIDRKIIVSKNKVKGSKVAVEI